MNSFSPPPTYGVRLALVASVFALGQAACSSSTAGPARPVVAASPPKDDGKSAEGGSGGPEHSAALEKLKTAPIGARLDRQESIRVPLPDADHWARVKFWGVKSLVGFRYGKEHHAVVAGVITHVDDNTVPGACAKSFEDWAGPMTDAFDVEMKREPNLPVTWNGKAVDIDVVDAQTATITSHDAYAVAYAVYPTWKNACLVVGVAIPERDDEARARAVRDRFARDVLPHLEVTSAEEPKERF